MVSVTQELDLDKLGRADELARMVGLSASISSTGPRGSTNDEDDDDLSTAGGGLFSGGGPGRGGSRSPRPSGSPPPPSLSRGTQVMVAFWQLRSIATSPPTFGPLWQLIGTGLTAGTSTALFFGGEEPRCSG